MTDEEYKAKMLKAVDDMSTMLSDIRDYQKATLVYLDAIADSPDFDDLKQECAKRMSDMSRMIEITRQRWNK